MKRSGPIGQDPEKARAWQERSARRARDNRENKIRAEVTPPQMRSRNVQPRRSGRSRRKQRNDAPWRAEVIALRGRYCRSCHATEDLQADHVKPRSQGGPSVVENGTMLCRSCHDRKTASTLRYRYEWLDPDQVAWLADVGWVTWDDAGQPLGRGRKHFEPRSGSIEMRG